jgi:hypothetical protein
MPDRPTTRPTADGSVDLAWLVRAEPGQLDGRGDAAALLPGNGGDARTAGRPTGDPSPLPGRTTDRQR